MSMNRELEKKCSNVDFDFQEADRVHHEQKNLPGISSPEANTWTESTPEKSQSNLKAKPFVLPSMALKLGTPE